MAKWQARLPLLIRDEEGDGFRVVKIPSSIAYLNQRLQRIPDEDFELVQHRRGIDGQPLYVLKNRKTDRFVQLTEPERFLWEQMNGRVSVQSMGTAYVLRFGSFDFEIIPALIRKLFSARLLRLPPTSQLRGMLARHRHNPAARAVEAVLAGIERLTVASRHAHDQFATVYRRGGFLVFSPVGIAALVVMTLLGIHGIRQLWPHNHEIAKTLADNPLVSLLLVKVFFWVTIILHQVVHALALPHYGRRVREFGFTILHGFLPTFYADVTDLFMAPRRARIIAAAAGPLIHLFLGMLYFWIASMLPPGITRAFLTATGLLQLQSLAVSLYPFWLLEMDGYHILVDLLGMPSLKEDALQLVRRGLWQGGPFGREEAIQLAYFVLSVVSIVAFVGVNVWLIAASS